MVGTVSYKVTGLQELERKLLGLGPAVSTRIGEDALIAAARPILATARRLVPVKTGKLKRSITTRKISARGTSLLARTIGFNAPGRFYSHLVEFGTSRSAARPFMRPAIDSNADRSILEMGRRLWTGIEAYCIGRVLASLDEDQ